MSEMVINIFDTVRAHLLAQNAVAEEEDGSLPHITKSGLKDPYGLFISDKKAVTFKDKFEKIDMHNDHVYALMKALSAIHDIVAPENWEIALNALQTNLSSTQFLYEFEDTLGFKTYV